MVCVQGQEVAWGCGWVAWRPAAPAGMRSGAGRVGASPRSLLPEAVPCRTRFIPHQARPAAVAKRREQARESTPATSLAPPLPPTPPTHPLHLDPIPVPGYAMPPPPSAAAAHLEEDDVCVVHAAQQVDLLEDVIPGATSQGAGCCGWVMGGWVGGWRCSTGKVALCFEGARGWWA